MFKNPNTARPLRLLACLTSIAAIASPAQADKFNDPTRPPETWLAAHPNALDKQETSGNEGARVAVIGKSRRLAVVDGRVVKVGDAIGDGQVLAIRHEAVIIRQAEENMTLPLAPGVEKTIRPSHRGGVGKSSN